MGLGDHLTLYEDELHYIFVLVIMSHVSIIKIIKGNMGVLINVHHRQYPTENTPGQKQT